MNKKIILGFFLFLFFIYPSNGKALSSSEYQKRHNCSNFELARAESNGSATKIGCYNTYQDAKQAMNGNSNQNLFIFDERGTTKIVDAKYALVDLTVNNLTYFYESATLTTRLYMAVNTSSSYGGVDAAFIDVNASNFAAKVKIANFTGWIAKENYEIVPLVWVKSKSSYTITNQSIKHNYVAKIQNSYSGSSGSTIGPKPDGIPAGTYYSYDGHYFYNSLTTMLNDYKNNTYNHAINKNNPYYNYYMYLSNHTKTTYSSFNIDEYIRNTLGYTKGVYSNKAYNGASRLYGQGQYFYNTQQVYGVNALLSFSLSRNETGNGRSNLAINKNNGFGLNAVDTNPTQSSDWYPTFSKSIFGYASKWASYSYSYATDWRYFGPAFGDKQNGMNVKYATDAYWSEKMAANYYNFDKSKGLNDYNYYQLGVITTPTKAYFGSSTTSKIIYEYPEPEDQVVIVGEVGSWYKVVSDINIDKNGNKVGNNSDYTKPYNWNSSYVYVEKSKVRLINKGKNGFIAPTSVTNYQDSNYTYDLYIEDNTLKPKVAITTKETNYYYDAALTSKKNQKVLKDKWIMVYSACYDSSGRVISYLVTSDYKYDQKEWVPADSIKFITSGYGKVTVIPTGAYAWVNSSAHNRSDTVIGGQFTYSYVPLMTSVNSDGKLWYKVPVNLEGTANSIGYILASDSDMRVDLTMSYATNNNPIISASNKTLVQGSKYNPLDGVSATDPEDGNITSKIKVITNTVDINKVGSYKVVYSVTDKDNATVTKEITITVIKNESPVIQASNKTIKLNSKFNELSGVTATDKEDGDLTKNIKVIENTVNTKVIGNYKVTYQVIDSYGNQVTKTITIKVDDIPLEKKSGRFDLHFLKKSSNKLIIKGYSTIDGIHNDLNTNISYQLIFENIDNGKVYKQDLERVENSFNIPYNVPSNDKYNYKYSWFEGEVLVDKIPSGDYKMYIEAFNESYYSKNIISNQLYNEQVAIYETSSKYVLTRNNYFSPTRDLELVIRDQKLANKTTDALSNQYGQYEDLKFVNNKLYIYGNAFSTGMNLSNSVKVTRKIIFENKNTYQSYSYNLSKATKKLYEVKLPVSDKLSKENAWYEGTLDISNLDVGEYSIYITTASNVEDIGELNEQLFRDLEKVKATINNKKYQFRVNYNKRYRVELIITK